MNSVIAVVATILLVAFVRLAFWTRRGILPPGPSALPVIGSVHHLTLEFQEKLFHKWRSQYGDVVYLKLFRTPTLVLNSVGAARDLLDKRSGRYSDRPRMVLLAELLGHDTSTPTLHYGDRFRKHRRWHHEYVGSKTAFESYKHIQQREVWVLLRNFLDTPDAFLKHVYRYNAATLLEITYGRRTFSMDDELVQLAEHAVDAVNESGSPGSMIVDFFPVLKHIPEWMPGAGFKKRAMRARECLQAWRRRGTEMVMDDMNRGESLPCILSSLIQVHQGNLTDEIEDIEAIGVDVYGAGTETTYGTLAAFMLAMARNPDILEKARNEIYRVIGHDRLPTFDDRQSLPYINALLEELLRWSPGLPVAIPHQLMSGDDKYRGYDIPAGSMVIPNIWGMTRDEQYYDDPEQFRPERFITPDEAVSMDKELPSSFVFGFGRRVCPGQTFADALLWLAIANIIAAFDIHKPVDENGVEYTPPASFKSGFTSQPMPFKCRIVPRSDEIAAMIRRQTDL